MGDMLTPCCRARAVRLEQAAQRRMSSVHLVLERLEDRGNRAAILRTAEALGLLHIHEIAATSPERGRARGVAHGGEKWLQVHAHDTPAACRQALGSHIHLLAALPPATDERGVSESWHKRRRRRGPQDEEEADGPRPQQLAAPPPLVLPLEELSFAQPTALCFGNERLGVSSEMLTLCDGAFTIPMHGLTESLNVSVAASIAVHHARVARAAYLRKAGALNCHGGDLSTEAAQALTEAYLSRGKDFAKTATQEPPDAAS